MLCLSLSLCTSVSLGEQRRVGVEIDEAFDIIDSFLAGFQADNYVGTSTQCSSWLRLLSKEFVAVDATVNADDTTWIEGTFAVTELISDSFASTWNSCASTIYNGVLYVIGRLGLFATETEWILSFVQNLLGNIVAFQLIYTRIERANDENDTKALWYQFGRIFILILDIYPIEVAPRQLELALENPAFQEAVSTAENFTDGIRYFRDRFRKAS